MTMRFTLIGGSGFIGSALARLFLADGHEVTVVDLVPSRVEGVRSVIADLMTTPPPPETLEGVDAVIHLAGKNIFGRWNDSYKRELMASRITTVRRTVEAIALTTTRPKAFICASAVGYYGDGGDTILTEHAPQGEGFLAEVCAAWEREAAAVERLGVRRVSVRTGIVLGKGGGHMGAVLPLFRLGLGGRLGSGRQWFPWVHIDDIAPIYRHAALTPSLSGPVNCAAPEPTTNTAFTSMLAHALHRPALLPAPRFALRMAFGEFADEILRSQRPSAETLLSSGYRFHYPTLHDAITSLVT